MSNFHLDFPTEIWEPLAKSRPPIHCPPGHLIYLQNTDAVCFYYLNHGQVKSFIQSEDGGERVLNIYSAGSLFGEASFFDELPRVSSAVALTECQIVAIDRDLVTREISRNPALAMAMMKYLARTVRMLSDQVDQMAFRPAQWRIARYLLSHVQTNGAVPCTQEDIAAAVSVSRVTVSRILSSLSKEHILELGYRNIHIRDLSALSVLCRL